MTSSPSIHLILIFVSLPLFLAVRSDHPWELRLPTTTTPVRNLAVRKGAPFRIAIFADLHFGEDAWTDWGPRQDVNSVNVMSDVLDAETPDMVVYLGDVITANNIPTKNASSYWDKALDPTRQRGIPWATLFGNHDDAPFEWPLDWFSSSGLPPLRCHDPNSSTTGCEEVACAFKGTTRVDLMEHEVAESNNTLSYSMNGPKELWPSVSNYVHVITSSNHPKSPVAFLYFLDSGGGSYPEVISNAQAEWFRRKSNELNPDSRVPELIFWHIPSKAFNEVAPRLWIRKPCVGSINKERVAAQESEMGIMKILQDRSSVKAVFVGHNHGLDWCCPYKDKLWLCFARHTGYGGYGNWARGSRILEITEMPFTLRSWIRMEDGSVHSEVILSS